MLMLMLTLMLMMSAVGEVAGAGGCDAVVVVEDKTACGRRREGRGGGRVLEVRPDEAVKGGEGSAAAGRSLAREAGTPWTWPVALARLWRVPRMLAKLATL